MRKLTTLLGLFLTVIISYNANANLLSFTTDKGSYTLGETVLVDIFVNDINYEAAEFGFDVKFNDSALTFRSFMFDDAVFFSAIITEADQFTSNTITLFSAWFENIDLPATSFKLGQLSFSALSEQIPTFNTNNLYVADNNFNDLTPQGSVAIPLPNSALLILLALTIFVFRKKVLPPRA